MLTQEERNRLLIDAILEKERRLCPGSIALIGIYGSFLTGDVHPRSDLDLLILINDDRGRQLAETFIEDDRQVGHDLYCTSRESLREDARYTDPNIAKLMDSEIVYCADASARAELEELREQEEKRSPPRFQRTICARRRDSCSRRCRFFRKPSLPRICAKYARWRVPACTVWKTRLPC